MRPLRKTLNSSVLRCPQTNSRLLAQLASREASWRVVDCASTFAIDKQKIRSCSIILNIAEKLDFLLVTQQQ